MVPRRKAMWPRCVGTDPNHCRLTIGRAIQGVHAIGEFDHLIGEADSVQGADQRPVLFGGLESFHSAGVGAGQVRAFKGAHTVSAGMDDFELPSSLG